MIKSGRRDRFIYKWSRPTKDEGSVYTPKNPLSILTPLKFCIKRTLLWITCYCPSGSVLPHLLCFFVKKHIHSNKQHRPVSDNQLAHYWISEAVWSTLWTRRCMPRGVQGQTSWTWCSFQNATMLIARSSSLLLTLVLPHMIAYVGLSIIRHGEGGSVRSCSIRSFSILEISSHLEPKSIPRAQSTSPQRSLRTRSDSPEFWPQDFISTNCQCFDLRTCCSCFVGYFWLWLICMFVSILFIAPVCYVCLFFSLFILINLFAGFTLCLGPFWFSRDVLKHPWFDLIL